jgi:hypothetical protein
MRTLSIVAGLLCLLMAHAETAQAKSSEAFAKRFQIIRSADGKLIGIRDRTLSVKFSVAPYVQLIRSQLLKEQELMSSNKLLSGEYDSEIKRVFEEDMDLDFTGNQASYNENVKVVVDSLKQLAVLNVNGVFTNKIFQDVVEKFQGKMTDAILLLDPTMVANVNDPTFFYKRNVTYKVVNWALDFARKRLSNVPVLNTVSYVIVQVEKLITERRMFHQNMLLHYLERFDEKELGLTHDEVNLIWSSIYESRIQWFAFWESSNAKTNWSQYGVNNFYQNYRMGTSSLIKSQNLYSQLGERTNFSFNKVTYNNEKVIVNLFDRESLLQNRPAVAYNYDRPTQVVRKRVLLTLAQLGLSFVPLSPIIKDNVGLFMKSFYEQQKITEGALYGYFESNGDTKGQNQIRAQYLNPFDGLTL